SIPNVFLLVAVLFLITAMLIIFFIKESYVTTDRGKFNFKDFIPLLKHPLLIQASLAAFALMVSNGTLAFALPLNVELIGRSIATTGMLLSTFGIVALIVFLTPINVIFDLISDIKLTLSGLFLIGIALIVLSFTASLPINFLAMVIYGLGFALIFPSMNKIVADASADVDRGKAYGIFYAFFSLGVVAGSTISGWVAQASGLPFLVSALIMISIAIFIGYIARKNKQLN